MTPRKRLKPPLPLGKRILSQSGAHSPSRSFRNINSFIYALILILGSIRDSTMSEINIPIITREVVTRSNVLARYMSLDSKESNKSGPRVGRFITVAKIRFPEKTSANSSPAVLITGFKASLTGYFSISFHSGKPFERAVSISGCIYIRFR